MPNSNQVPPEASEEERELPRPSNNNNNNMDMQVGVGQPSVGGVGGVVRRDENSISFRHFLQPHSDVVPQPAPTCRSRNRGTQPGAVDLVDMAMALPDFVQDHLVVESLANAEHQNDGGAPHSGAVDLNVLNEILPDFTAASQSSHALPSQSGHSRRRNMQEESASASEVSHGTGGTSALPDFLSDGPMQCTDTNVVDNSMSMTGPSSSRSTSRILNSSSLTERNRIVDDSSRSTSFDSSETLRSEVERLRRELTERNRRISHLEGEVLRLRTNASMLENALRTTEQNLASSEARRLDVEREAENLRRQDNNTVGASGDAAPSTSSGVTVNGSVIEDIDLNPHLVRSIANSSEALISQLLQNMTRLKGLANTTTSHRSEEQPKKSSEHDESQQN